MKTGDGRRRWMFDRSPNPYRASRDWISDFGKIMASLLSGRMKTRFANLRSSPGR
jgi:hypothetical protein